MLIYNAALFGIDGINPFATSPKSGFAKNISVKKHKPIIVIKPTMKSSIFRMPNF